jgi:hypothetical protein
MQPRGEVGRAFNPTYEVDEMEGVKVGCDRGNTERRTQSQAGAASDAGSMRNAIEVNLRFGPIKEMQ